eukprot:c17022_g1_i1 orf=2-553(-)
MSNNEDHRLSQWRSQLRRDRRPGSLRSAGAHVPSHLAELHSSQIQQLPRPSSALDRMRSFRTGRRGRGDDEVKELAMMKGEEEEEGSSACDVGNRSTQSLTAKGDSHKRSSNKRGGAWELACALAYAYLHQQPFKGLMHGLAPYSAPFMCPYEEDGEDHCREHNLGSSKNRKQDVTSPPPPPPP